MNMHSRCFLEKTDDIISSRDTDICCLFLRGAEEQTECFLPGCFCVYWDTGACSLMNVSFNPRCFMTRPVSSCSAHLLEDAPLFSTSEAIQQQLNFNWETEGRGENRKPCNALMSCHNVSLRQIINLDHLSRHEKTGRNVHGSLCGHRRAFQLTSSCLCLCRYEEVWWRGD